jgi:CheY-like chemotaxis protein
MYSAERVLAAMSQGLSRPRNRQLHHILIIDDSARLRQTLADLIVANCLASGKIYRVLHSDKDGKFTQSNEAPNPGMVLQDGIGPQENSVIDEFAIYTAPSPKQALVVINSPLFTRLTIISDVMMPADTEVGLIGMLEAISRRNLPVNLVFASSDAQNIYVIAKLVETGKAYFLVKQGTVWEDLSRALVHRTDSFRYKTITPLDFEGMQKLGGPRRRATTELTPEPVQEPEILPTYGSFLPTTPPATATPPAAGQADVAPPPVLRRAAKPPPMPNWDEPPVDLANPIVRPNPVQPPPPEPPSPVTSLPQGPISTGSPAAGPVIPPAPPPYSKRVSSWDNLLYKISRWFDALVNNLKRQ